MLHSAFGRLYNAWRNGSLIRVSCLHNLTDGLEYGVFDVRYISF